MSLLCGSYKNTGGEKMRSNLFIGNRLSTISFRLSASLVLIAIATTFIVLVGGLTPSNIEAELIEGVNYQVDLFDSAGTNESTELNLGR